MTSSGNSKGTESGSQTPFIAATVASIVWTTLMVGLAFRLQPAAGLPALTLNEWGDFMAGAFAPLAFLWLVVGYVQQGVELKQNTAALLQQEHALKLQAVELAASVAEQKSLGETTKLQLDHMKSTAAEESRARRHQAQPIPEFEQDDPSTVVEIDQKRRWYRFSLMNVGSTATQVTVSPRLDDSGEIKFDFESVGVWANLSTLDCRCSAPRSGSARGRFRLKYVDASGRPAWQDYEVAILSERLRWSLRDRSIDDQASEGAG